MSRGTIGALALWAIVVLACAALAFCQMDRARTASAEGKLNRNQTGAAIESGADAVNVIGNRAQADAAVDAATKENNNEIRQAEGAAAPVAPAVRDAGLASLCRRAAYRLDPKCVQQARSR